MKRGIYIYGVIKASELKEPGEIGAGNNAIPEVLTLRFKDIAAVVSWDKLVAYDALAREQVVRDLTIHQFVIEKVMAQCTILPVKFGTMLETEDEVLAFLENGYTLLHEELGRMAGKLELDVVARWELSKALQGLSRHNSQIQEQQQKLALQGNNVSIKDKIELGQSIARALTAEKVGYQQVILQALEAGTEDVCPHDLVTDEMIFNAAFLLEKKNEERFYTDLDTLDQKLERNINFRVVGPLPPYSFSTVLVKKVDPASIEEAKKALKITGAITDKTIRDAYHQLVKEYHPDRQNGADSQEFQLVHDAYNTLKDFLEHGLIYPALYQWRQEAP